MYDDWIQHTTDATIHEPAPSKLRNQKYDSLIPSDSPRSSSERTRSNVQTKAPPPRQVPELPTPDVPRRPKSVSDLRTLANDHVSLPQPNGASLSPPIGDIPPRPQSRNDMDTMKQQRFGRGAGQPGEHRVKQIEDIQDELDFADWYGSFERELGDAGNDEYRLFQLTLDSHITTCNNLLASTDSALNILDDLRHSFSVVDTQTSTFQSSCANLINRHNKIQSLSDSIATNLLYFTELESITRALARPGSEFVRTSSFREMLYRLDRCIEWMDDPAHQKFPEVENYAPKFRQLLTRALTLIRNNYVSSVKEVAAEVEAKMWEKKQFNVLSYAWLYGKFRVDAPVLRELVSEIEKRSDYEEYMSLLEECYSCHSAVRTSIINPVINQRLTELTTKGATDKDLISFAGKAISFLRDTCLDEFDLFYAYFSGPRSDIEVYNFLRRLCQPLYQNLQSKTGQEQDLLKLCELCFLVRTRYMPEPDDMEAEQPYDRTQLDFGQLMQNILYDLQGRVSARAHAIVREEIEHYKPRPEDLDYPAKCLRNRKVKEGGEVQEVPKSPLVLGPDKGGENFDTEKMFAGWYPTLRKCIWLLSKIYRQVNQPAFIDLAHHIVHATTNSLLSARTLLQKSKSSPVDAQLFLIRHLLQLKSQIVAFDIDVIPTSSHLASAPAPAYGYGYPAITTSLANLSSYFSLSGLLGYLRPTAFPQQPATPAAPANSVDSRLEIDQHLRAVITEFTTHWASLMTAGITGAGNRLAASDSPDPAARVKTAVEREIPAMRKKLLEYVEETRIVESLVGAVFEAVLEKYKEYWTEMFGDGTRRPREGGEQWGPDGFAKWAEGGFGLVGWGEEGYYEDGYDREGGRDMGAARSITSSRISRRSRLESV